MNILYVHGFASGGNGSTVNRLREYFPNDNIISYDIPISPISAVEFIRDKIVEDNIDVIIGTSLGGYYTLLTSGCMKISINPPYNPNTVLDKYIDKQVKYFIDRDNGDKYFTWEKKYHDEIEYLNKQIEDYEYDNEDEYRLIFGNADDVVSDSSKFVDFKNKLFYNFGHRVSDNVIEDVISPIVNYTRRIIK